MQPDPSTADMMVRLGDVLDIIDGQMSAPDGYFYARRVEQIMGWEAAARRIKEKVEDLANGE